MRSKQCHYIIKSSQGSFVLYKPLSLWSVLNTSPQACIVVTNVVVVPLVAFSVVECSYYALPYTVEPPPYKHPLKSSHLWYCRHFVWSQLHFMFVYNQIPWNAQYSLDSLVYRVCVHHILRQVNKKVAKPLWAHCLSVAMQLARHEGNIST